MKEVGVVVLLWVLLLYPTPHLATPTVKSLVKVQRDLLEEVVKAKEMVGKPLPTELQPGPPNELKFPSLDHINEQEQCLQQIQGQLLALLPQQEQHLCLRKIQQQPKNSVDGGESALLQNLLQLDIIMASVRRLVKQLKTDQVTILRKAHVKQLKTDQVTILRGAWNSYRNLIHTLFPQNLELLYLMNAQTVTTNRKQIEATSTWILETIDEVADLSQKLTPMVKSLVKVQEKLLTELQTGPTQLKFPTLDMDEQRHHLQQIQLRLLALLPHDENSVVETDFSQLDIIMSSLRRLVEQQDLGSGEAKQTLYTLLAACDRNWQFIHTLFHQNLELQFLMNAQADKTNRDMIKGASTSILETIKILADQNGLHIDSRND